MDKVFDIFAYLMGKAAGGGGGGGDVTVESKSISSNGTFTAPPGKAYSPVTVDVPNSYAAGDEGKVVSNGELVAQSSDSVTQNGTVDTTLINSLLVNVSGGGGSGVSGTFSPAENLRSITLSDCVGKKNIAIWPTTSIVVISAGRTHYGELWIDGIGTRMVGSTNSGGTSWSLNAYSGQSSWDSETGTMTITAAVTGNYGGFYASGMTYGYHAW